MAPPEQAPDPLLISALPDEEQSKRNQEQADENRKPEEDQTGRALTTFERLLALSASNPTAGDQETSPSFDQEGGGGGCPVSTEVSALGVVRVEPATYLRPPRQPGHAFPLRPPGARKRRDRPEKHIPEHPNLATWELRFDLPAPEIRPYTEIESTGSEESGTTTQPSLEDACKDRIESAEPRNIATAPQKGFDGANDDKGKEERPGEFRAPPITLSLIKQNLAASDSSPSLASSHSRQSLHPTSAMDHLRPESALKMGQHRREAMRLAKVQEAAVNERCRRTNTELPGYAFDELIGKGSFGRVYKGRNTTTQNVVAIKVLDIDEADYKSVGEEKDEQIRTFNKEIQILRAASESGAPNLNQMIEALPVYSQLWLVCEYCPGGSVKTLMRATDDKLAEKYIVVVARELAKALKGLHAAKILHRDIKAANVLIHEEGRLQLCDFGVATVLETKGDKRQTFIGTLHWMAPEQWDQKPEYSDEIDVWAFGCTIYECALGKPPNADLREPQQLRTRMRRLNKAIELPESGGFPENLRSLVSFTLSPNAANRPSMTQVLDHDYLRDTEHTHPTSGLSELVNDYYSWLWSGGQRTSLFMKGGAVVSDAPGSLTTPDDEWNFSTTVDYEKRISKILDVPEIIEPSSVQSPEGEVTPKALKENVSSLLMNERTATQQANFEARVQRGADLSNIFDQNKPTYEYKTKHDFVPIPEPQMARRASDLPLRAMAEDRPSSIASNVIDLGDFDSSNYATVAPTKEETIRLADAATIRAKRGDSKLYKEDSNTDIPKITRTPSAEGDYPDVAQHDGPDDQSFSFPPNSWKKDESNVATTSTEDTSTVKKPKARQTMEWSFDEAMSDVEKDEPAVETTDDNKTKKHATMQWSFADAMKDMSASPPTATTTTSSTITPSRPGLLRQATMPVTHSEFSTAEEEIEEPPRPSTAQSETSSIASSDADPFALDPDMPPMPDAIAKALDERNISHYYYTEGRTLFADQDPIPYDPAVFTGQQPPQPYPTGAPARVGEPGFPGQNLSAVPPFTRAGAGASAAAANTTMARDREEAEGGPFALSLPPIRPPDPAALAHDADPEVVARELSRGLGDLEALLRGIGEVGVFGGGGRGRKGMEAGGGAGGAGAGAGGGGGGHERGRSSDFETTDEE